MDDRMTLGAMPLRQRIEIICFINYKYTKSCSKTKVKSKPDYLNRNKKLMVQYCVLLIFELNS